MDHINTFSIGHHAGRDATPAGEAAALDAEAFGAINQRTMTLHRLAADLAQNNSQLEATSLRIFGEYPVGSSESLRSDLDLAIGTIHRLDSAIETLTKLVAENAEHTARLEHL